MEYSAFGKLVGVLISIIGTIAATSYNLSQSKKVRVELLEKLDDSIKNENKHTTCEIFRLLYGVRMNHKDITTLLKDDDVVKILYALKKTPGLVTYSNGEFLYREIFNNKWVKAVDKFSSKGLTYISGICLVLLALAAVVTKGTTSLTALIMAIGFSVLFTIQIRQESYDRMIENLVNKKT
ncbi:MAG: hypothetical protein GQ532_14205 [Methylomarinum sp.]|nr:hypothetical protein [Methylomarinum sp.]